MSLLTNAVGGLALLAVASAAAPALSQEPSPSPAASLEGLGQFDDFEDLDLDDLLNVTVSIATGETQTPEDAPNIVTVITEEEIRRSGARTLAEVLELVPGIEVVVDNIGKTAISMRGVAGTNTLGGYDVAVLVLFNGHRLNEEISGSASLVNLEFPVDNIEKIEFIRGPASALHGASAFLGVVNIVTHAADRFRGTEVSAGVGSFGTQQYNVLFGRAIGQASVSGFLQFSDTDGPRLPVPADAQTRLDQTLGTILPGHPAVSRAPGLTRGDHRAIDANVQVTYGRATLNGRFTDQASGGFFGLLDNLGEGNRLEGRQLAVDATYRQPLSTSASLLARAEFTQTEMRQKQELFPPGFANFVLNTPLVTFPDGVILDVHNNHRRAAATLRVERRLFRSNRLTVGVDAERSSTFDLETFGNFDAPTRTPLPSVQAIETAIPASRRDLVAAFFQDTWEPSARLGLTAGLRWDRYSDFGSTVNPRAGVVWRAARGLNLKLLYGRAFRAPSFIELFVRLPGLTGNPDLVPTTVNSIEASAAYRRRNVRITVNYYANFIRNLIIRQGAFSPSGTARLINAPGLDGQGFEVEAKRTFGPDNAAFLNYSYQLARNSDTGDRIPDVPSHFANVGGTLTVAPRISVSPAVVFRSSRPRERFLDIRPPLPAVALVNVSVRLRDVYRGLTVSATAANLLDKRYADPAPATVLEEYPRPGRSFFVRAGYRF